MLESISLLWLGPPLELSGTKQKDTLLIEKAFGFCDVVESRLALPE